MQFIKYLLFVLVSLAPCFGAEKKDLVGEWKPDAPGGRFTTFVFKADGAFITTDWIRENDRSSVSSVLRGTYQVDFTQKPAVLVFHFVAQRGLPSPFDRSAIIEFLNQAKFRMQLAEVNGSLPKIFGAEAGTLTKQ